MGVLQSGLTIDLSCRSKAVFEKESALKCEVAEEDVHY